MHLHICKAGIGDIILSQKRAKDIWQNIALFNTCVEGWEEMQAGDVSGASVFLPTFPIISGFLRLSKNMP